MPVTNTIGVREVLLEKPLAPPPTPSPIPASPLYRVCKCSSVRAIVIVHETFTGVDEHLCRQ